MPLTLAQQVRLVVNDRWRLGEEILNGDGSASGFKLRQGAPFSTLMSASAYLGTGAGGWSGTGATIDLDLGRVTFAGIISALTAIRVDYQWAVFSDDEIGYFTAAGGTVNGAAKEAVKVLMFDNAKRARWSAPDGSSYDDTKSQADLKGMYDLLKEDETSSPEGGLESWGEQQANFYGDYNA